MHGFEYYTGICFQFLAMGERIGGGGRYDSLVPSMNGKEVPACGFALYVDPIMRLLPLDEDGKSEPGILVKGRTLAPGVVKACFTVAECLRDAGHPAELCFEEREESGYRWVVLVSGKEPSPFVLKDCIQKRRREVASLAEILKVVSKG
jgi:histidyl-tRNA synthetase